MIRVTCTWKVPGYRAR